MQVGYARASTIDQEAGFQAQLKALAGCESGTLRVVPTTAAYVKVSNSPTTTTSDVCRRSRVLRRDTWHEGVSHYSGD
jgi:hypothetical protein